MIKKSFMRDLERNTIFKQIIKYCDCKEKVKKIKEMRYIIFLLIHLKEYACHLDQEKLKV